MPKKKVLIKCPRCLGKGHVDDKDIQRLKRELFWRPGPVCAYCNGDKKVFSDMPLLVNPADCFLTSDLSEDDRTRYINKDPEMLKKAYLYREYIMTLLN